MSNNVVTQLRWTEEDVYAYLEFKGFKTNKENLQKLLDNGLGKALDFVLLESGWDVIMQVIDETENLEPN
ncbi:hypothetical protein DCC39_10430 [Pueribacillus theae]|uniref:Uncharacterized protein n=1 Tax=Pueribacillus theae TaxID=2171751 RepID=A0A2U1K0S5_9BACI|nr:hypothetical protein [Pueribacillus theae]PWA11106.1 hypothetical protein DCC39_10430 [Pueribacillus theae]